MEPVSVSSVITASFCPLRLYLERSLATEESARYTICKQISYHLGGSLDADAIWSEVLAVTPGIDAAMRLFLDDCIEKCRQREWPSPSETDVAVISERLGIRGMVDKISDREPYFALTRSSEAPPAGIYARDRIRVACYAACVQETLGLPAEGGYIEYVPSGVLRLCKPEPRDRREMLKAIRAARRVAAGEIPRRPLNAPCDTCPHEDRCLSTGRKLSDML
ncbi:MAG TPA: Dna2/Cas4 domain-containing protein [Methanomicrobiales archaeon]|nr:Dna2/Cas4 domain-containing protein [Methanomicrobiales archaeon]